MVKRKVADGDNRNMDHSVPIPIQSFLWRQSSPFIRPKLGKQCDASCVSFERVLVQNILHGLSPSLCQALQEISRWRLIQTALPHVIHCCAALLNDRKASNPDARFTSNQTKLLYTIHWIILDAASECEDNESQPGLNTYLHSLDTVQLFVYLFAPLIHTLQENDFQSLKLENGLRLWQALWDFRQPDIPCFSTPVKAKRVMLKAQKNLLKVNFNMANIYIGKGTSQDNIYDFMTLPASPGGSVSTIKAPLARMSDICALSTTATETSVEIVCEICNETLTNRNGEISCKCGVRRSSYVSMPDPRGSWYLQGLVSPSDKDFVAKRLEGAIEGIARSTPNPDVLSASYFDVAVLRCLFCLDWAEEGIYWALRYMHRRLLEICDELHFSEYTRERSKSLPTPELPPECKAFHEMPHPSPPPSPQDYEHHSDHHHRQHKESRREPAFKRMRVAELKHIIGDKVKMLRRRESAEQFDLDSTSGSSGSKAYKEDSTGRISPEILGVNGTEPPPRPSSALEKLTETEDSYDEDQESCDSSSDIIRRKSMPALRRHKKNLVEEDEEDSSGSGKAVPEKKDSVTRTLSLKPELLTKPIITITRDSPDPTVHSPPSWLTAKRDSCTSDRSSMSGQRGAPLQRSFTDTHINYSTNDEIQEVPGSVFYIDSHTGQINYMVVLQAVHVVASRNCSARTCGVILNILNCLIDLGIVEKKERVTKKKNSGASKQEDKDKGKKKDGRDDDVGREDKLKQCDEKRSKETKPAHTTAMETIVRIYCILGCPHGCGDGVRGSAGDHLRVQGVTCLQRLLSHNSSLFRRFLTHTLMGNSLQDIMDFLHAFIGCCVEPGGGSTLTSPQGAGPKKTKEGGLTGYANNFGEPIGAAASVQGQLMINILKPLVTKFVDNTKDLHNQENIGLYCDVRQFLCYVKEMHGGTFRRVALSGLLDAYKIDKNADPGPPKTTKIIKRTMSMTSESGDDFRAAVASVAASMSDDTSSHTGSRRSIFRRKATKKQVLPTPGAMSDSETLEEGVCGRLSPRVSMSATEDDPPSGPSTPKRKFSKFNIGTGRTGRASVIAAWRKAVKSDHEDDSATESPGDIRKDTKGSEHSPQQGPPRQKRMSFKAASQATLTFLTAKKRIEDFRNWGKRRMSKRGSIDDDSSRRGSHDPSGQIATEVVIIREKKLVNSFAVKSGLMRFNFMIDCCQPGSVPDANMVAALLDLEAPIVGRAMLLLECAYFVNRCNHGDWPNWMKLNLPGFRQTGLLHSRNQPSGYRRNLLLQRAAGRMFHQWGEAIGNHLCDIMSEESDDKFTVIHQVKDEGKKKELRLEDDEEDFLDEATVNHTGSDCPYALRLVACQLLLEITTFLRETYRCLPKSKSVKRESAWEKNMSSRRWSSVLSSPGHSERSNSRSSQGEASHLAGSPSDRKISFAVFGQSERSDSIHSSTTTISQLEGATVDSKGRRITPGRKLLRMRRGSGHGSSFRRSFKLKRPEGGGSMKRVGSTKARKVSTQSLQSNVSIDEPECPLEEAESVGMMSDDTPQESPDPPADPEDQDYSKYMPWIKVVVQLANTSNFICDHQSFCHPNCYERQRRSCIRLITAVKKIYNAENEEDNEFQERDRMERQRRDTLKEKLKRRESMFQPSSPTRRRESTPLLEKIKTDTNLSLRLKLALDNEKKEQEKKREKPKDEGPPIFKYIKAQVQNLTHSPMSIISKSAPILSDSSYIDMMPVAWELLLECDQELAAAAATVFILASVKVGDAVQELMVRQLQHEEAAQRIHAALRFGALWRFRWQVWPRMEDGATNFFKVPPPSIDFVLPSPTIGLPLLTVVDPPWLPHFKTKVEEVTINQEESKSFVTATTTRRKQQQEMIHRALLAEDDRRRAARENFHMTSVAIMAQAAYEPALHHGAEDHEEALAPEEVCLAARRMSVAPGARASNLTSRNMSGRNGSMFWTRPTIFEGEEERVEHLHSHHLQVAQHFFPSCICSAALPIIHLLEDSEVNADGVAVSEVAEKVVWSCLVEEPTLFMRTFLEKLTVREKQEELIFLLRKLTYHIDMLPAQTAHCLFNYLVGFVMFYVRSPAEGGQEAIAEALSLIWQIVPSVNGIYFKDLKQTLRKEQCDPTLMITANVPNAKKLIVHGPDLSSIPSQFPIHEDTQFSQILIESLDFFNIPDEEHNSYFLIDTKTNQMHNLNSYVRDFYFFRRNHYPQLSLVHLNPEQASTALQKQAFTLKFLEMGKVLFSLSILENSNGQQLQNHVSFLHEELLKLPSFPRKALESEFGLHQGVGGRELYGVDMLHKYVWSKLMARLFRSMSSTITYAADLPLFLNVISGTLYLHAEDTALLKLSLSTYINAARRFKQVFSTTGFLFIMPTMLQVYSNHQSNPIVCTAIEFVCRQLFLLHRNPFMLQMFGSVAPLLDIVEGPHVREWNKVSPHALFSLLLAMDKDMEDPLDLLEMVDGDKPLTALDFCYIDDPDTFTIIDAINLCVTVIAYACDSVRAMQMLTILEAILPNYLHHIKEQTTKADQSSAVRDEMNAIGSVAVAMRALMCSAEVMTRNFSGPQRHLEAVNTSMKPMQNHSNHSPQGATIYHDEVSDIRFLHMEEGMSSKKRHMASVVDDDTEVNLTEFRKPRNSMLCVMAEFYSHCSSRVKELRRMLADPSVRTPELLDYKAHNRLADIANTLLKVAPYDSTTMGCKGLQRYLVEILPLTDWAQEAVRPAINLTLRRMERIFTKIYKKPVLRRKMDWEAAANLLKGIYNTLSRFTFIAHLPHLKTVISVCLSLLLADEGGVTLGDSVHSIHHGDRGDRHRGDGSQARVAAPPAFCSAVIKLTAMQMQALGDQYLLEHICGGMSVFPSIEKSINVLLNLILPLCIRMGCGRRDCPKMRQPDIHFAVTVLLHALVPPSKHPASSASSTKTHVHLSVSDIGRTPSLSSHGNKRGAGPRDTLNYIAFLGLRVVMVCFEKQLSGEWCRIAKCVTNIGSKLMGGLPLWKFVDFVVTTRNPLFLMLQPFIQYKMMAAMCETEREYFLQHMVHQKLQGYNMPHACCRGSLLVQLAAELRQQRDECNFAVGDMRPRTGTMATDRSDHSYQSRRPTLPGLPRSSSVHDLLEQHMSIHPHSTALAPTPTTAGRRLSKAPLVPQASATGAMLVKQASQASDCASPALHRKASQRINATDGSLILERYTRRPTSQEDDGDGPSSGRHCTSPRKIQRQASMFQRGVSTKQLSTTTEPLYENVAEEAAAAATDAPATSPTPSQASSRWLRARHRLVIFRGRLRQTGSHSLAEGAPSADSAYHDSDDRDHSPATCGVIAEETGVALETGSLASEESGVVAEGNFISDEEDKKSGSAASTPDGCEPNDLSPLVTGSKTTPHDFNPRMHRLQRQDAKSRKTFKIKRHRSTIKGNIIRSATVKGGMRTGGMPAMADIPTHSALQTPPGPLSPSFIPSLERMATQQEESMDAGDGDVISIPIDSDMVGAVGGVASLSMPPLLRDTEGDDGDDDDSSSSSSSGQDEGGDEYDEEDEDQIKLMLVKAPPVGGKERLLQQSHEMHSKSEDKISEIQSSVRTRPVIKTRVSRPRFVPKSRSHDDDAHISVGTARARIARHGHRGGSGRSRSSSSSPGCQSDQLSPIETQSQSQAYMARSDSQESLSVGENSALLRKEEKSSSRSELLIFFDELTESQDTCV